jgi:hypothetical protein
LFVLIIQDRLCTPDLYKDAIALNLKFGSPEASDSAQALSELRMEEEEEKNQNLKRRRRRATRGRRERTRGSLQK